jgi:outer membrane protein OmpA-like peptidoglycan-associated protein
MKKIILFIFTLSFAFLSAQQPSQWEKRERTDDHKKPHYTTWGIGLDIGNSFTMMDMYSSEANDHSLWSDYGNFGDIGASLKIEKWYTSMFGIQGQAAYQKMSGSKKEYAFTTPSFRTNFNLLFNLSGAGANNKTKLRRSAWILHAGVGVLWNKPEMYTFHDDANPGTPLASPVFLYTLTGDGTSLNLGSDTDEKWNNSSFANLGIEYRWRFAEYWDLKVGTQALLFFGDNVDGSETLGETEPNVRNSVPKYFPNTSSDASLYTSVGVNWYIGGKKVKRGNKDARPEVIIYANPISDLERRVSSLEDNVDKIMEDGDNDGVSDYFDKDPETPEGYVVDGSGVSQDTDRDGIPDELDEDPYSTKGAQVDANGNEYDQDADGVPDSKDLEQNTPTGQLVNYQGVSIKDRIGGGGGNDSYFLPSVYFDFNKSLVTTANYQRMAVIANYMKANPDAKLEVVGHTDPIGTESYNTNLSERRAKAVVKALVNDFDMDESRLEVTAKGETELVSKRNDINRRVEFRIK